MRALAVNTRHLKGFEAEVHPRVGPSTARATVDERVTSTDDAVDERMTQGSSWAGERTTQGSPGGDGDSSPLSRVSSAKDAHESPGRGVAGRGGRGQGAPEGVTVWTKNTTEELMLDMDTIFQIPPQPLYAADVNTTNGANYTVNTTISRYWRNMRSTVRFGNFSFRNPVHYVVSEYT